MSSSSSSAADPCVYGPTRKAAADLRWNEEGLDTPEELLADELLERLSKLKKTNLPPIPRDRTSYSLLYIDLYQSSDLVKVTKYKSYNGLETGVRTRLVNDVYKNGSVIPDKLEKVIVKLVKKAQEHVVEDDDGTFVYQLPPGQKSTPLDRYFAKATKDGIVLDWEDALCLDVDKELIQGAALHLSVEEMIQSSLEVHQSNEELGFMLVTWNM
jgi:hypothetical protein